MDRSDQLQQFWLEQLDEVILPEMEQPKFNQETAPLVANEN